MTRLAAGLIGLMLVGVGTPAMAKPGDHGVPSETTAVSCGPAGGVWRLLGPGGLGGEQQYAADAWATYTFSCRVKGRLLVVRHRQSPIGPGPCSAAVDIRLSAWVDGVKVLSREQVGDYAACLSREGADGVVRISLTANGLTVCRAFAMPAEMPGPRRCRAVSFSGSRDRAYVPPRPHPPIRLRRTTGGAACNRWASRLKLVDGRVDRSFAGDEVPQTAGWRDVNDGESFGFSKTARFDLDNDGATDIVNWSLEGLVWDGHRLRAPSTRIADGGGPDLIAFAVQPVRLDGGNLIYLRALPRDGRLGNFDVYISDRADTSRFLVEARPDGTTRLVCGWGPEKRLEDEL